MIFKFGKAGFATRLALGLGTLAISVSFKAGADYPHTREEFVKLPEYCRARYAVTAEGGVTGSTQAEYEKWKQIVGQDFNSTHHFCAGINEFNHALLLADKAQRRAEFTQLLGRFDKYLTELAEPGTWVLKPEYFFYKARTYEELGMDQEAASNYQKILKINPRHIPSIQRLAALYAKAGQKTVAVQILQYGVQVNPNSKSLKTALEKAN
jgi:tetratricopeptide (TPR) repeat protein